jgi:hypothetical protein
MSGTGKTEFQAIRPSIYVLRHGEKNINGMLANIQCKSCYHTVFKSIRMKVMVYTTSGVQNIL